MERERAAIHRYIVYMAEQQRREDDSLPQLPSALVLSRPSSSASAQPLTAANVNSSRLSAADYGPLPSRSPGAPNPHPNTNP